MKTTNSKKNKSGKDNSNTSHFIKSAISCERVHTYISKITL